MSSWIALVACYLVLVCYAIPDGGIMIFSETSNTSLSFWSYSGTQKGIVSTSISGTDVVRTDWTTKWIYALISPRFNYYQIWRYRPDATNTMILVDNVGSTAAFAMSPSTSSASGFLVYARKDQLRASLLNGANEWILTGPSQTYMVFNAVTVYGNLGYVITQENQYYPFKYSIQSLSDLSGNYSHTLTHLWDISLDNYGQHVWEIFPFFVSSLLTKSNAIFYGRQFMQSSSDATKFTIEVFDIAMEKSWILWESEWGQYMQLNALDVDFGAQAIAYPYGSSTLYRQNYKQDGQGNYMLGPATYVGYSTASISGVQFLLSSCQNDCGTNGNCDSGSCSCYTNFYQPDCSVYCLASVTCSGHGTCSTTTGACLCETNWGGLNCSQQATVPPFFPPSYSATNVVVDANGAQAYQAWYRSVKYQYLIQVATMTTLTRYDEGFVFYFNENSMTCTTTVLSDSTMPTLRVPANSTWQGIQTCWNQQYKCNTWLSNGMTYFSTVDATQDGFALPDHISTNATNFVEFNLSNFSPNDPGSEYMTIPSYCRIPSRH